MTTDPMLPMSAIDDAVRRERWVLAEQLIADALTATPTPALHLARARLELARDGHVDETILRLQALLADDGLPAALVGLAHELIATGYVRKRLPAVARQVVEAAEAAIGTTPGLHVVRALAHLTDDDRGAARDAYQAALALAPDHGAAQLGLGELYVAMASFAEARQHLGQVPESARQWGAAQRALAGIAAALGDRAADVAVRAELLRLRPDGDLAQSDGISLAHALVAAGRHAEGVDALRAAWQRDPASPAGGYARERLTCLENAIAAGSLTRRELTAFPTTAQKWNYCGPAVLELVLRYFAFTADQDSIAALVKREHGTPMIEIAEYLRSLGVVARRVEGSTARLRAALDLGCPVIVQEEYSTSSHVAVLTGYDDALGVFIAQDPMRHQPMVKSFAFTESAGTMYGGGVVVVLGPEPIAAERAAACDAAELVEARHLALVDECSARRARAGSDGVEPLSPGEVIARCDAALALAPGFRLAHYMRLRAVRDQVRLRATSADDALRELALTRLRFGGEEWCRQLHADSLVERGLYDEAFVEAFEAHRRDPHDEWNLQLMGETCWLAGDLAGAETHLLAALREGPDLRRAAENLAAVYLRMLEEADEGDDDAPAPSMPPRKLRTGIVRDDVAVRAAHFSAVALAGNERNPFNHAVAGELARRRGDLAAGIACMQRCVALDPDRSNAWHSLAEMQAATDDADAALATHRTIVERFPDQARSYASLAVVLRATGAHAAAADVLRAGFDRVEGGREALLAPLFDVLSDLGTGEAAAAQVRALAESARGDDDVVRGALDALERNHQRGHAIALARLLADAAPNDPGAVWRLARLLDDTGVARAETEGLLRRLVELVPDVAIVRVRLAWHVLAESPAEALALVEPMLDQQSPDVFDAAAAALAALGRTADAARALDRALQAAPSRAIGLARLASRHSQANRYARALELVRLLDLDAVARDPNLDDDDREFVEDAWLTAHRLAGRAAEALAWTRRRCAGGVPSHLAFEVYYAYRSQDRALAAQAADVRAREMDSPGDKLEWEIIAASLRAKLGDPSRLDALAAAMPEHAGAWAELADAYTLCNRFAEADAAAARAYALEPTNGSAFTAYIAALSRQNRLADARACAEAYSEARPWEHQGPERLGILLAKLGEVEPALAQSARAVDAAPYCHVSQQSRALALLAAGDLRGALDFARQAAGNEPSAADADGDDDDDLLIAALTGDAANLERGLAALEVSHPGAFLAYRARLREVCAAGGA